MDHYFDMILHNFFSFNSMDRQWSITFKYTDTALEIFRGIILLTTITFLIQVMVVEYFPPGMGINHFTMVPGVF